jgi:hypothetical protein
MDMSKLPRLSQSPQPPPQTPPTATDAPQGGAPSAPTMNYAPPDVRNPSVGAEVWISLAIGLILMLFGRQFGTYLISLITHEAMHTGVNWTSGPNAGQEVAYPDLIGFVMLTDASIWLFGLTLVFDAALLYFSAGGRRLWLVGVAFALTAGVGAFNAFVCAKLFSAGITPIMSLFALAFGVYMAIYQWGLLKDALAARAYLRETR